MGGASSSTLKPLAVSQRCAIKTILNTTKHYVRDERADLSGPTWFTNVTLHIYLASYITPYIYIDIKFPS